MTSSFNLAERSKDAFINNLSGKIGKYSLSDAKPEELYELWQQKKKQKVAVDVNTPLVAGAVNNNSNIAKEGSTNNNNNNNNVINPTTAMESSSSSSFQANGISKALAIRLETEEFEKSKKIEAESHLNWKLYRVVAGHRGTTNCVSVDPTNLMFATGSSDRAIKYWDLATGTLKLTKDEAHASTIRGLSFSNRHIDLYSCGEDKEGKSWDLETNQLSRVFHGHTDSVYCITHHPSLDLVITGSKDKTVRVWDLRSRLEVVKCVGHKDSIVSVQCQASEPQIVSGSEDTTVRLWDIRKGSALSTITHHRKGVRAVALHPKEFAFASASTGTVKKFALPAGRWLDEFQVHAKETLVYSLAINSSNVFCVGTGGGVLRMYDWKSCKQFQDIPVRAQPGSLPYENSILSMSFDMTGTRLITCNGDKSIQMYKEIV